MELNREREADGGTIWIDNVREDLKEKKNRLDRNGEATISREVWRNLVRTSSSAR